MRELTFELEYEAGADPLMDVFVESSSLSSDGIASCVRRDRFWRLERFVGPSSSLERVEQVRLDPDTPREVMTHTECRAVREYDVLERAPATLVLHTHVKRLHTCNSVMALAARHLDLGVVFQTKRRENCQRWRLLMRSEENVDVFYDQATEYLGEGIELHIGRLGPAERLEYDSLATVSVSEEQRETLRAAIEHGYYETPRQLTVVELAEVLGVPQSTVSYRLRRAEAQLAKGYLHRFSADRGMYEEENAD